MTERPEDRSHDHWEPKRTTLDHGSGPDVDGPEPVWAKTSLDAEPAAPAGPGSWKSTTLDEALPQMGTTLDGPRSVSQFVEHNLPAGMAADYELIERLGGGGEAVVYRARDRRHNREVALKIYGNLAPQYTFQIGDEEHRRHFPHEHCVDLYERREESGSHIEVMELCPEGTLEDYARGRTLQRAEVTEIVAEVAEAIHAMGTWRHGDIKPQNILVRSRQPLDLILTDFGLTRDMGERSRMTSVGHGTRLYQPPGTGHSARKEDDWWALGIIVVELAGGKHPFDGLLQAGQSEEALRDYLIHNPVPMDHVSDRRICHLARGLLARRPEDRFGYEQVRQWLDGGEPELPLETGSRSAALDPFAFQGKHYTDPVELAEAIRTSPRGFEAGQGIVFRNLVDWSSSHPNHARIRHLERRQESLPGRVVAGLLAALLADDGRLIIDGLDLTTAEGIAALGTRPDLLSQFRERHALERCSEVLYDPELSESEEGSGTQELARLDHEWRTCFDEAEGLLPDEVDREEGSVQEVLLIESWRVTIDPARVAGACGQIRQSMAEESLLTAIGWFESLWDRKNEPPAVIALLASLPAARSRAEVIRTERAAQAEKERLETERRREAEANRRRQEEQERRRQVRARNRLMLRRLRQVWGYAFAPGIILLVLAMLPLTGDLGYLFHDPTRLIPVAVLLIHQLCAAVVTALICIPGARRERFEPPMAGNLHLFAVAGGVASVRFFDDPVGVFFDDPVQAFAYSPWLGCVLVGVHQALFLASPLRERMMTRDLVDALGRLSSAHIVAAILCFVTFRFTETYYGGPPAWLAYAGVVAYQLLVVTLIVLPVIRTQWFSPGLIVLSHLVPIVLVRTAEIQLLLLPDRFQWAGRECHARGSCELYALDAPIPEPHHWAIWGVAAYAVLCGLHWLVKKGVASRT